MFDGKNVEISYELIKDCFEVDVSITDEEIDIIEKDTRSQAKGAGFFRHRAGRIIDQKNILPRCVQV